jgi:hypothetical protein
LVGLKFIVALKFAIFTSPSFLALLEAAAAAGGFTGEAVDDKPCVAGAATVPLFLGLPFAFLAASASAFFLFFSSIRAFLANHTFLTRL